MTMSKEIGILEVERNTRVVNRVFILRVNRDGSTPPLSQLRGMCTHALIKYISPSRKFPDNYSCITTADPVPYLSRNVCRSNISSDLVNRRVFIPTKKVLF